MQMPLYTVDSLLFVVYQFLWISWIIKKHNSKNAMNICTHVCIKCVLTIAVDSRIKISMKIKKNLCQ